MMSINELPPCPICGSRPRVSVASSYRGSPGSGAGRSWRGSVVCSNNQCLAGEPQIKKSPEAACKRWARAVAECPAVDKAD